MKDSNITQFTIAFLGVLSATLHCFSMLVSFNPVSLFLNNYINNSMIIVAISVAVLVMIETGVYSFVNTSIETAKQTFLETVVFRVLAVVFVAASMYLTTKGAAGVCRRAGTNAGATTEANAIANAITITASVSANVASNTAITSNRC